MLKRTAIALSALLLTTACAPAIVAGGAGAVSAVTSERGIGGTFDDIGIKTGIQKRWFEKDADLVKRLDLTVQEGRVLITGLARDPNQKLMASQIAWEAQGVKEVINEAKLNGEQGFASYAKDTWISTKLRTLMTFDGDVAGRNYTIETVDGVVYLMGYARSQDELNRVTSHASGIDGVQKVVSYARIGNGAANTTSYSGDKNYSAPVMDNSAPTNVYSGNGAPTGGPIMMEPIPGNPAQ